MSWSIGPGRIRTYRGKPGYEIPADFGFWACLTCGAEWLSGDQVIVLSGVFEDKRDAMSFEEEQKIKIPFSYRTRERGMLVDVHGPNESGMFEVWYATGRWYGSYTPEQVDNMFPKPTKLSPAEKKVAVHLLRQASEQYSNHGCNDLDLVKEVGLTLEEALELKKATTERGEEVTNNPYTMDWLMMSYLATRLEQESD